MSIAHFLFLFAFKGLTFPIADTSLLFLSLDLLIEF